MSKKLAFSTLVYFVISMVLAVTWHLVLFHEQYLEMGAFTRDEPLMFFGMTAVILQGLVFGYFYPLYLKHVGKSTFKRAVTYSLLMGINVWSVMVLATAAKFNIEPIAQFVAYGTAFQILQFSAVGIGLNFVHR